MRLKHEEYFERGLHKAVPTSRVDAIELGLADAAASGNDLIYGRTGIEEYDEVYDHFSDKGIWGVEIVEERIRHLPDAVEVTPEDAMAALEFVKAEVDRTECDHVILDAILCLIARRSGFESFVQSFAAMTKWYA
jgi:hypothetical protein